MASGTWLRTWKTSFFGVLRARSQARSRFRPRLEALEGRVVPAQVFWTNPLGGDWDTPSNWSSGQVPGQADDVVINLPGITLTHLTPARDIIHGLTSSDPISLVAGSLSVTTPSQVNAALSVDAATLSVAGLTADSLTVQDHGTFSSTGAVTVGSIGVESGASFTSSGDVTVSGDADVQDTGSGLALTGTARLTVFGNLRVFTGSTFTAANAVAVQGACTFETDVSLTVPLTVGTLLQGGVDVSSTADVTVTGYADVDGGTLTVTAPGNLSVGSLLKVEHGGSVVCSNPVTVQGTVLLTDAGTFTGDLAAQDLTVEAGADLSAPDSVRVTDATTLAGGALSLGGAAELDTATLNVEADSVLQLPPGSVIRVATQAAFVGPGDFTVGGTYDALTAVTTVSDGTVTFADPAQLAALYANAATVNFAATARIGLLSADAASVVNLATLDAGSSFDLQGPGLVNVNGNLVVPANEFLSVDGGGTLDVHRNLSVQPRAYLILKRGVVNVTGALALAGTLELAPDLATDLAAARLQVGGAAQLGGTFLVDPGPGSLTAGQAFPVLTFGSQSGAFQNTYQSQPGQFYDTTGTHALSLVVLNDTAQGATPIPIAQLLFGPQFPGNVVYALGPFVARGAADVIAPAAPSIQFVPAAEPERAGVASVNTDLVPVRSVSSNTSSGGDVGDPGQGTQPAAPVASGADLRVEQSADAAAAAPRPTADRLVLPAAADRFSEHEIGRSLLLGSRASSRLLPGALVATFLAGDADQAAGSGDPRRTRRQPREFPLTDCLMGLGTDSPPAAGGQKAPDAAPGPQAAREPERQARGLEVSAGLLVAGLLGTSLAVRRGRLIDRFAPGNEHPGAKRSIRRTNKGI